MTNYEFLRDTLIGISSDELFKVMRNKTTFGNFICDVMEDLAKHSGDIRGGCMICPARDYCVVNDKGLIKWLDMESDAK